MGFIGNWNNYLIYFNEKNYNWLNNNLYNNSMLIIWELKFSGLGFYRKFNKYFKNLLFIN